ncbi:MAG: DUF87 domain-containing protein, partial [Rhodobacteraceae bacterium]|nr:DUF87 domain-containing protein [Paracoccaceae bacterium]
GIELSVWLALIIEHAPEKSPPIQDRRQLVGLVGAHWRRGLQLLDQEWADSNGDIARFVHRLVDAAGLPTSGAGQIMTPTGTEVGAEHPSGHSGHSGQIDVPIGQDSSGAQVTWSLNGAGGSPHSAIMGGVGAGKTRTAVAMLRALQERARVPLLAFDFKNDLGTDAFQASILEPPRAPIPLDVLAFKNRDAIAIDQAALRFRDSFSHLKGSRVGDRQRDALYQAARAALAAESPCQLDHIRDALLNVYEAHEMKHDGAVSTMQEICRFPLFQPTHDPAAFFQQSWIIKLPSDVPQDSRMIVVNLVLDALNYYLNSLPDSELTDGARDLRLFCVVDEAHNVLGNKLPALSNLIRMSRSKGGAIMLISQSPDDFSGQDDDFLSEMGLVMAFSTNAPPRNAARILGKGAKLHQLQTGECFAKLRGDPAARKIRAWKPPP